MRKPVVVIGAGGHAKVVVDTLLRQNAEVLCLTDADPTRHGTQVLGLTVLGDDGILERYPPEKVDLALGVGSVQVSQHRREIFERLKIAGYCFRTVVHPTALIGSEVVLGEGCQIMAGVLIQPGTTLGVNVLLNSSASVDHDCLIGDHAHIGPGAILSGHVTVGADCNVGCGASIIQGICLGDQVQIGAGASVVSNFGNRATILGVPGREQRK